MPPRKLKKRPRNEASCLKRRCQNCHIQKEKRYAWNNFDYHCNFNAGGCNAHLASQPTMGLLSQRRTWIGPSDFSHFAAIGSDLICRHGLSPFGVRCRRHCQALESIAVNVQLKPTVLNSAETDVFLLMSASENRELQQELNSSRTVSGRGWCSFSGSLITLY